MLFRDQGDSLPNLPSPEVGSLSAGPEAEADSRAKKGLPGFSSMGLFSGYGI